MNDNQQEKTEHEFAKMLQNTGVPSAHSQSHKELLRKAMLAEHSRLNKGSRHVPGEQIKSSYKSRIIKIATLALLSAGIFMFFAINGVPQFSKDPVTHQQQVIFNKEDLIAKALEAEEVKRAQGEYRNFLISIKVFTEDKTYEHLQEISADFVVGQFGNYLVTIIRDAQSGQVTYATKFEGSGSFYACDGCTEKDIAIINNELPTPDMPIREYERNLGADAGTCGTSDGSRVIFECYGMIYVQQLPIFIDGTDLYAMSSRAEFIDYMQSMGMIRLESRPEAGALTIMTALEEKIYQMYHNFERIDPKDLYTAMAASDKVTYTGKKTISGKELETLEYRDTDQTNEEFIITLGFDPTTYQLGYVQKQIKNENNDLEAKYEYLVISDNYSAEPAVIEFIRK
jgi:hypothetical protein